MIVEGFMWTVERFPQLRPALWRTFYRALGAYSRRAEYWTFMNYGYWDEDPGSRPELAPEDQEERYPIYLYHRVAARVDLRDREVLEIGSGRGGGASYVKRYLGARRVLGVDIAGSAVELCRRRHKVDGLQFCQGDALALPVPDGSFDAVLNVESAHCYPSIDRFLREVRRVLRPGGHLLYADLHHVDTAAEFARAVDSSGLQVIEHADISAGVAAALALDSDRRRLWSAQNVPPLARAPADAFVGVAGTRVPAALARGSTLYLTYVMRKAEQSGT